jgi:hypothetical protein
VTALGNEEILAAVELVLSTTTDYGFSIDYDAQANPIIKIAPIKKSKFDKPKNNNE